VNTAALRKGVSDAEAASSSSPITLPPYPMRAIGDAVAMVESGVTDVVFASSRADYRGSGLLRWLLVPMLPDPAIRLAAFSNVAAKIVAGESRLSAAAATSSSPSSRTSTVSASNTSLSTPRARGARAAMASSPR
jgi:hypothetical protein